MIARPTRPPFSTLVAALSAAACALVLAGCTPNQHVLMDDEFSTNLLIVDAEWPGDKPEKIMSDSQVEVWKELGRPDFIRLLFNRRGDVLSHTQAQHQVFRLGGEFEEIDRSWIYRARELEVCFLPGGVVERRPLTHKVATLVEYGDPHEIKTHADNGEKWFYYDQGIAFKFVDDQLVGEPDRFQRVPYTRTK